MAEDGEIWGDVYETTKSKRDSYEYLEFNKSNGESEWWFNGQWDL